MVQNIEGNVKKSMGNGEAQELICMTHGHEVRWGNDGRRAVQGGGEKRGDKNGTTVIA